MTSLLLNILIIVAIIYIVVDIVTDLEILFGKKSTTLKKIEPKVIGQNPGRDIKLEFELVEQIIKGTADLGLSYNRDDGTFTATLKFTDPIDNVVYNFSETSTGVQDALNKVIADYVNLLESQGGY